jgi:hypothetical protein
LSPASVLLLPPPLAGPAPEQRPCRPAVSPQLAAPGSSLADRRSSPSPTRSPA